MKIVVLNAGSSSLKYQLIDMDGKKPLVKGHVDGIGLSTCKVKVNGKEQKKLIKNHDLAVKFALDSLKKYKGDISCIGHRVVHGGEHYHQATLIDDDVIKKIDELSSLAPLHNPHNLAGILACKKLMPKLPQVAVFDTAFHQTIPKHAFLYAVPYEYYEKHKLRKYGFHGTSHKYVANKANELLSRNLKSIVCHLGNGDSITAVKDMKSMDTSMGFTPVQGLIMGTRSGDVGAGAIEYIADKEKLDIHDIIKILNKKSGLLGLDGYSDMRTVHEHAENGDERCRLAIEMFCYRLVEYIAAYYTVLQGADTIIFTAGIGQEAWYVRKRVCEYLAHLGVNLDEEKNKNNETIISTEDSSIMVMVVPTNEEEQIAAECMQVIG